MKKAIILYDSLFGNTKKVALSLSRGLEEGGLYVDCTSIQEVNIDRLKSYDLIAIGGPTHFHGASKKMKQFLPKLNHLEVENKAGFAFETKGEFKMAGSAAKRITRYMKKIGLKIIHPTVVGIVLDQEGPLKDYTLEYMEQMQMLML